MDYFLVPDVNTMKIYVKEVPVISTQLTFLFFYCAPINPHLFATGMQPFLAKIFKIERFNKPMPIVCLVLVLVKEILFHEILVHHNIQVFKMEYIFVFYLYFGQFFYYVWHKPNNGY